MQVNKAIFLDKDGTLIPDIPYNINPDKIRLEEGVVEGLKLLVNQGFDLYVVSNQSGIAKGYFSEDEVFTMRETLQHLLIANKLPALKGFYFCPHHPDGIVGRFAYNCNCRKPKPGLLQTAASNHDISLKHSWMIGDILHDIEAGNRAGCKSILINNGNETEWEDGIYRKPFFVATDFLEAAKHIVSHLKNEKNEYRSYRFNATV